MLPPMCSHPACMNIDTNTVPSCAGANGAAKNALGVNAHVVTNALKADGPAAMRLSS